MNFIANYATFDVGFFLQNLVTKFDEQYHSTAAKLPVFLSADSMDFDISFNDKLSECFVGLSYLESVKHCSYYDIILLIYKAYSQAIRVPLGAV